MVLQKQQFGRVVPVAVAPERLLVHDLASRQSHLRLTGLIQATEQW